MKTAYFDCIAGASGGMILGASGGRILRPVPAGGCGRRR